MPRRGAGPRPNDSTCIAGIRQTVKRSRVRIWRPEPTTPRARAASAFLRISGCVVIPGAAVWQRLTFERWLDVPPPWLALGAGVSTEVAQASLKRSMARTGISQLEAVRLGRAHAVWHHFYNSPFNVAAVQAFAKWLHPALFADLDPEGLLHQLHQRFQPFPIDGVYWTSLP